jgi:small-conductance mechanosensitive channel
MIMPWDPQFWTNTLNQIAQDVIAWLPNLAVALLLLLVGWLTARVIQAVLSAVLRRVGLDRLAERVGAANVLANMGMRPSAVDVLARLVYWLVLLIFLLAATDALGLEGVVEAIRGIIAYLPNVLAAALILLFGGLIAQVVGDGVGALAEQSGLEGAGGLGQLVRYILLVFAVILALGQLGVETTLLTTATLALIGTLALGLAIAFGLGSRELARNIMAGFHVGEAFVVGQRIHVGEVYGQLVAIGAVKSMLKTDDGMVSVPNHLLTEQAVTIEEAAP